MEWRTAAIIAALKSPSLVADVRCELRMLPESAWREVALSLGGDWRRAGGADASCHGHESYSRWLDVGPAPLSSQGRPVLNRALTRITVALSSHRRGRLCSDERARDPARMVTAARAPEANWKASGPACLSRRVLRALESSTASRSSSRVSPESSLPWCCSRGQLAARSPISRAEAATGARRARSPRLFLPLRLRNHRRLPLHRHHCRRQHHSFQAGTADQVGQRFSSAARASSLMSASCSDSTRSRLAQRQPMRTESSRTSL